MIDPALVDRFAADFARAVGRPYFPDELFVFAVSGGPDSLGMLLLGHAAFGDRVRALTVDHGLRPESATEAAHVAAICATRGIAHATLQVRVHPAGNIQLRARQARYGALAEWCAANGVRVIATAHHVEDQAETLLMRLARGSGVNGLAGMRACGRSDICGMMIARPTLGWRRVELAAVVAALDIAAVDDPTNHDRKLERVRARQLIASTDWLWPERLAAVAGHLADADEAVDWAMREIRRSRCVREPGALVFDARALPIELTRRGVEDCVRPWRDRNGHQAIPGPKLMRLIARLRAGKPATLAGARATVLPDGRWRFEPAPPRRSTRATGSAAKASEPDDT